MSGPGSRSAVVIGAAGQDGSYLCEHLLSLDYQVHAVVRDRTRIHRLAPVIDDLLLIEGDVNDARGIATLIDQVQPREIYNLAAVSFGPDVWEDPMTATRTGTSAVVSILDAVTRTSPRSRVFQASSAWVFGNTSPPPQNERTPYRPVEAYGVTKAFADQMIQVYRSRNGTFACSGILFNHESPRRSERFVSRRISRAVASIRAGMQTELTLDGLDAVRDWGFAGDYARAAWLMLQADDPVDHVIATGVPHTVREMCEVAFAAAGLDWSAHVRVDHSRERRGPQAGVLIGDSSAVRQRLGWQPSVTFTDLVTMMVDHDLAQSDPPGPQGGVV
jgi:GDPmannose 4,6-dehydratase